MDKNLLRDIFEWDTENWSKALPFWESIPALNTSARLECLELGSNRGGLSLWLASKGHKVLCTDYENPGLKASPLHTKYGLTDSIQYLQLDALKIPYTEKFDVVVFKSILGGISRNNKNELTEQVIHEIYKSLKPGGVLLFAENLSGSSMHKFFRTKFVSWGKEWNYLSLTELPDLFSSFSKFEYKTRGFLGLLGRNEFQRNLLGKIDKFLAPVLPSRSSYILIAAATK